MPRPSLWCDKARGLSDGQRKLCRKVPGLQTAIKKGIEKGLSECEREFMWNRWNCTLLGEKSFFQRAPGESLVVGNDSVIPVFYSYQVLRAWLLVDLAPGPYSNARTA